ncbi:MAG TPA: sulfotransferase [Streptosporangiaceae bacterium]|jgi:hypothetical protein
MNSSQAVNVVENESSARAGCRDPLFLLAPARSYSTVTIALLAGHPELYGLPETSLFLRGTVGEILAMPAGQFAGQDRHQHLLMGLERAIAQLHDGSQANDALERALDWIRQRPEMPTTEVMDYLLRLVYPRIAVEKSPATVESGPALARCLRAYPGARYLHLTRHPVSTQRSMLKLYSQFYFPAGLPHAERVRRCLLSWYSRHLRIVQALQNLPRAQWMRVRGEDLIGDPRAGLPAVLDWLGLSRDDAVIDRMLDTQSWEFSAWDGHIGFGGADPKFLAAPALRPAEPPGHDVIDPDWDISDDLRYKVVSLARYLGY